MLKIFAVLMTGFGLAATPAVAQTSLKVSGFGNATELPEWIAQDRGMYAREGLTVAVDVTRGSVPQFTDVLAGKYDIASTLFDNVVAYAEGQGEKPMDSDIIAVMGSHYGMTNFVTKGDIKTFPDIKGKLMGVDALSSGYTFVLFRLLEKNGLVFDRDYKIAAIGGGKARYEALLAGKVDGALISAPGDRQLKAKGFNILADPIKELGGYQGGVFAVRRQWAAAHDKELVGFLRGTIAGLQFIFDNRAASVETMRKWLPGLSEADAQTSYDALISGQGGLDKEGRIDQAGVKNVLDMRASNTHKQMGDPAKYVDLTWYKKALAH